MKTLSQVRLTWFVRKLLLRSNAIIVKSHFKLFDRFLVKRFWFISAKKGSVVFIQTRAVTLQRNEEDARGPGIVVNTRAA